MHMSDLSLCNQLAAAMDPKGWARLQGGDDEAAVAKLTLLAREHREHMLWLAAQEVD